MQQAFVGLLIALWTSPTLAQHLEPIGFFDDGDEARAWAVTSGTPIVVGSGERGQDNRPFLWDFALRMQELPIFPTRDVEPRDISADGRVIVGTRFTGTFRAFRYSQGATLELSPFRAGTISRANAVSGDGRVVVGMANSRNEPYGQPAIWIDDNPTPEYLGSFRGVSRPAGFASAASFDGSVVTGVSGSFGWRWTESTGMVDLGMLPDENETNPSAISDDGTIIGGYTNPSLSTSWLWTEADGLTPLIPPSGFESTLLTDMSADGRILVGSAGRLQDARAIVWLDPSEPAVLLSDLLGDSMLDEWTLVSADGISPDGRFIVGNGRNELGQAESWLAVIPSPATAFPLFIILLSRRRRLQTCE